MSGAQKIIDVLGLFTLKRGTWTPLEAAQSLGISRATAYRYFAILTEASYIGEVGHHRYALGPKLVELDRQIRLVDPLVQVSVDAMVNLARVTGGTALLCRLYGTRVLCIHQERGSRFPGNISFERGRAMPLYSGATSKVILAFLPLPELEEISMREPAESVPAGMPRSAAAIHAHLASIREERICIAVGEVDPNRCGIAVPIFHKSRVIGSLSVVLVATEAKGRLLKTTKNLLNEAGLAIESELESAERAP